MKRKSAVLSAAIITIASAVSASAAEGKIVDGRTLVPVRGAFEELGFDVEWNSETSTAYISDEDNFVEITKGLNYIVANDNNITPDVPQQIIDDRFYLPLRAVGESVGANVEWDGATKTAHISYNGKECYVNCGGEAAQTTPTPIDTKDFSGTWKCDYVYNDGSYDWDWEVELILNKIKNNHEGTVDYGNTSATSTYVDYEGTWKLTCTGTTDPKHTEDIGAYYVLEASFGQLGGTYKDGSSVYQMEAANCLDSFKFDDSPEQLGKPFTNWFKVDGNDLIQMDGYLSENPIYDTNGNLYRFIRVK